MIRSIFLILSFLLFTLIRAESIDGEIFASSNGNLVVGENDYGNVGMEKALTATCENSSGCTYSLYMGSISTNSGYTVYASIFINNVMIFGQNVTVTNNSNPFIHNFNVNPGDSIVTRFAENGTNSVLYDFKVYSEPNGQGAVLISGRQTDFPVGNNCMQESCTYTISQLSWSSILTVNVNVNGVLAATLNSATTSADFLVKPDDAISVLRMIIGSADPNTNNFTIKYGIETILTWYFNSYFTPMYVPNPCPFPSSPFGGGLVALSPYRLKRFLDIISAPLSDFWYLLTKAR